MAKYENQINYKISTTYDNKGMQQLMTDLTTAQQQLLKLTTQNTGLTKQEIGQIQDSATKLRTVLAKSVDTTGKLSVSKFSKELNNVGLTMTGLNNSLMQAGVSGKRVMTSLLSQMNMINTSMKHTSRWSEKIMNTLGNTVRWGLIATAFQSVMSAAQGAVSYIKQLDESLTQITMVSGESRDNMKEFAKYANQAARGLGSATTDYTNAVKVFIQEGFNLEESKRQATQATILGNVSEQDTATTADQITAYRNAFHLSIADMDKSLDKLANIANKTAANVNELMVAAQKSASTAASVGASEDSFLASIATIQSVTREAAENIGNGLKSIYTRLADVKMGKTTEDGIGYGQYSSALKAAGIDILDSAGNVKSMDQILTELQKVWKTLDDSKKLAVGEKVAGRFQYNRFAALMNNAEYYEKAFAATQGADGAMERMQADYMEGIEAISQRIKTNIESIFTSLYNSGAVEKFAKTLQFVTDRISDIVNIFENNKLFFDSFEGVVTSIIALVTKIGTKQIAQSLTNMTLNREQSKIDEADRAYQQRMLAQGKLQTLGLDPSKVSPWTENLLNQQQKLLVNSTKYTSAQIEKFNASMKALADTTLKVISVEEEAKIATEGIVSAYTLFNEGLEIQEQNEREAAAAIESTNEKQAKFNTEREGKVLTGPEKGGAATANKRWSENLAKEEQNQQQAKTNIEALKGLLERFNLLGDKIETVTVEGTVGQKDIVSGLNNFTNLPNVISKQQNLNMVIAEYNDLIMSSDENDEKKIQLQQKMVHMLQDLAATTGLTNEQTEQYVQLAQELNSGMGTTTECLERVDIALEKTKKYNSEVLKTFSELAAGLIDLGGDAAKYGEILQQLITETEVLRIQNEQYIHESQLQAHFVSIGNAANVLSSELMSLTMMWSSLSNIVKTWNDDTKTTEEKLESLANGITMLLMSIGMMTSGFGSGGVKGALEGFYTTNQAVVSKIKNQFKPSKGQGRSATDSEKNIISSETALKRQKEIDKQLKALERESIGNSGKLFGLEEKKKALAAQQTNTKIETQIELINLETEAINANSEAVIANNQAYNKKDKNAAQAGITSSREHLAGIKAQQQEINSIQATRNAEIESINKEIAAIEERNAAIVKERTGLRKEQADLNKSITATTNDTNAKKDNAVAAGQAAEGNKKLGKSANTATGAVKKLSTAAKGLAASLAWMAAIAVALAIIKSLWDAVTNEVNKYENKADELRETQENLNNLLGQTTDRLADVQEKIQEIKSGTDDPFKGLTKGTAEWTKALQENITEFKELLKYVNLVYGTDYYIDDNGAYRLTEEGAKRAEEQLKQQQRSQQAALSAAESEEIANQQRLAAKTALGGDVISFLRSKWGNLLGVAGPLGGLIKAGFDVAGGTYALSEDEYRELAKEAFENGWDQEQLDTVLKTRGIVGPKSIKADDLRMFGSEVAQGEETARIFQIAGVTSIIEDIAASNKQELSSDQTRYAAAQLVDLLNNTDISKYEKDADLAEKVLREAGYKKEGKEWVDSEGNALTEEQKKAVYRQAELTDEQIQTIIDEAIGKSDIIARASTGTSFQFTDSEATAIKEALVEASSETREKILEGLATTNERLGFNLYDTQTGELIKEVTQQQWSAAVGKGGDAVQEIEHLGSIFEQMNSEDVSSSSIAGILTAVTNGDEESVEFLGEIIRLTDEEKMSLDEAYATLVDRAEILTGIEEKFDLTAEEVQKYADNLQEAAEASDVISDKIKDNEDLAIESAIALRRLERGYETLTNNYEDWTELLSDSSKRNSKDFSDMIDEMQKAFKDIANIDDEDFKFDQQFLIDNYELAIRAAAGDLAANDELSSLMVDAITKPFLEELPEELPEGFAAEYGAIFDQLQAILDGKTLEERVELDLTDFIAQLNVMIDSAYAASATAGAAMQDNLIQALSGLNYVIDYTTDADGRIKITSMVYNNTKKSYSPKRSGGGGGSKKPKTYEYDRYERVNNQLDLTASKLEELQKNEGRLAGTDYTANLIEQNKLLERQVELEKEKDEIRKGEIDEVRQALSNYGVQFDEEGIITNWKQIIDKMNQEAAVHVNDDDYIEYLDKIQEYYERYNELDDEHINALTEIAKLQNEIQDKLIESFKAAIELANTYEEVRDSLREVENTWAHIVGEDTPMYKWEKSLGNINDLLKGNTKLANEMQEAFKNASDAFGKDNNTVGKLFADRFAEELAGGASPIQLAMQYQQMGREGFKRLQDESKWNFFGTTFTSDDYEQIREFFTYLNEYLGNMLSEIDEEIQNQIDLFNDEVDRMNDKFDRQSDVLDRINDQIDYYAEVMEAVYGDNAIDELIALDKQKIDNIETSLSFYQGAITDTQRVLDEYEAMRANYEEGSENWLALTEQIEDAQDKILDYQEKYNDALKEQIELMKDIADKQVRSDTRGFLSSIIPDYEYNFQMWELLNENEGDYLDLGNRAFELQKLTNRYNTLLDNADTVSAQKKINDLMSDELKMLREKDQLSEYDVEFANAKLDLLEKQLALEDAQLNKTTMRLRRDSQGNYSYVYSADEDAIQKAKDEALDAWNELYNIARDRSKEIKDEIISASQDLEDKIADIANNINLSVEQREALITQAINNYKDKVGLATEQSRKNITDMVYAINHDIAKMELEPANSGLFAFTGTVEKLGDVATAYLPAVQQWQDAMNAFTDNPGTMVEDLIGTISDAMVELDEALSRTKDRIDESIGGNEGIQTNIDNAKISVQELLEEFDSEKWDSLAMAEGLTDLIIQLKEAKIAADELALSLQNEADEEVRKAEEAKIAAEKAEVERLKAEQEKKKDVPGKTYIPVEDNNNNIKECPTAPGGKHIAGSEIYENGKFITRCKYCDKVLNTREPNTGTPLTMSYYDWYASGGRDDQNAIEQVKKEEALRQQKLQQAKTSAQQMAALGQDYDYWLAYYKKAYGLKTGGYTGTWTSGIPGTDNGRLAILHQKELVLNEEQTKDILAAVQLVKTMTSILQNSGISDTLSQLSSVFATRELTQPIEQSVTINADFPAVESAAEIKMALEDLENQASIFAFRTR